MGAWDVGVLENDIALDAMGAIAGEIQEVITETLLNSEYEEEVLLGVALVDASLNGSSKDIVGCFYEYKPYFDGLKPMGTFRDKALKMIRTFDTKSWNKEYREKRQAIYNTLEKRLESAS